MMIRQVRIRQVRIIIKYYNNSLYIDGLEMDKILVLSINVTVAGDFQEKNKMFIYVQANTQTRKVGIYKKEGCRGVSQTRRKRLSPEYLFNLLPATLLKKIHNLFCKCWKFFWEHIFLWNISWKLFLKAEFCEKWQTSDILIKKRSWSLQLFQKADVLRESVYFWVQFHKRQYCTCKEFFIYARK